MSSNHKFQRYLKQPFYETFQQRININIKEFKITDMNLSVEKNNDSILKIMDTQVQSQTKDLSNCFYKIKNLACELSLNDGLKYLRNIFRNIVQ